MSCIYAEQKLACGCPRSRCAMPAAALQALAGHTLLSRVACTGNSKQRERRGGLAENTPSSVLTGGRHHQA